MANVLVYMFQCLIVSQNLLWIIVGALHQHEWLGVFSIVLGAISLFYWILTYPVANILVRVILRIMQGIEYYYDEESESETNNDSEDSEETSEEKNNNNQ